ncbi:Transposase [Microbacterium azadirachtae]|uniref:Transposase n=1 Tax=Microbacterium azadirachtae TaxID=582680 RepID=A0A1I6GC38_9MICO|nr:IS110 family transposase [Microbacterium azadirachtae]SFR39759.1 Transposase [Microbacterium azadirachtae]
MTIVAQSRSYVIGVDCHARTHTYAIIDPRTGELLGCEQFPTTPSGISRATSWAARRTGGDASTLWAIEGVAMYGAQLARAVAETGFDVVEAPRTSAKARHGIGKSDPIDARMIAAATLGLDDTQLRRPRQDTGGRAALRTLVAARDMMAGERTMNIIALTALLRVNDLGVDARKSLTRTQIATVSKWRERTETLEVQIARAEAVRLARRIRELNDQLAVNKADLVLLIKNSPAAPVLEEPGVGPITAAMVLTAWSHRGRIRSEAAFAALAGVSPIPASSGNTSRHRLNRGGDRRLNQALHMAVVNRIQYDPDTRAYVTRRMAQGHSKREILRILKRYLARQLFRTLNALHDVPATA